MNDLSGESRVWVYQSSKAFSRDEIEGINQSAGLFAQQWTAHNQQLKAWGGVVEDRFIVLMVDERMAGASGCSIDSSVHFMKGLEQKYDLDLFNRMMVTYRDGNELHTIDLSAARSMYQKGELSTDTLIADTLVQNKGDFDTRFFAPLESTWLKDMLV